MLKTKSYLQMLKINAKTIKIDNNVKMLQVRLRRKLIINLKLDKGQTAVTKS